VAGEPQQATPTTDEWLQVERLLSQRKVMCVRLMRVLGDEQMDKKSRLAAARKLAELRYEPAIAILIQHLELTVGPKKLGRVPGIGPELGPWEEVYPCVQGLSEFGASAIPLIVENILDKETSEHREFLLGYCLTIAGLQKEARRYVIGIHNEHQERFARTRLAHLLQLLAETE
jgi:hypothetical protein